MAVRNIRKQLAGVEDLLLGKGKQDQERSAGIVSITKIDIPAIVETIDELKLIDINKYTTAIVKDINNGGTFIYIASNLAINNGITIFNGWTRQAEITAIVETIDELSLVDITKYSTVIVKDIDRGGTFIYDNSKALENNGGTIFNGWVRQYDGAVNVKWFGAKGDGITDDTVAIQNAINIGKNVHIPNGIYNISNELTIPFGVAIIGNGIGLSILNALSSLNYSKSVLKSNSVNNVIIKNLSILGNTDGVNGAGSGVHFKNSSGNTIENVFINNTSQAGIRLEEQNNTSVKYCTLDSIGRSGYTDNHGIMIYSIVGSMIDNYNIKIIGNRLTNILRKGITDYAPDANIYNILVRDNIIKSCNLGAIYLGTVNGKNFNISDNLISDSYVGIQYGQGLDSIISNNIVKNSTGDFGIGVFGTTNTVVTSNIIENSNICGIDTFILPGSKNKYLTIKGNIIRNSNRSSDANGAGILLADCENSIIEGNSVYDDLDSIKTIYGIAESPSCINTNIVNNNVKNMITLEYTATSTTSNILTVTSGETYDLISGISTNITEKILTNGNNNDVDLPPRTGILRVTGLTAKSTITGIKKGKLGRHLTIINDNGYDLTLVINSGLSVAGNRLYPSGSISKIIPAYGSANLVYTSLQGSMFWVEI